MKASIRRRCTLFLVVLGMLWGTSIQVFRVNAAPSPAPPGPDRFTSIIVPYTKYTWWLLRWADNSILCTLEIDHEGTPTANEVYFFCGGDLSSEWTTQPPCPPDIFADDPSACPGYYIFLAESVPDEREVAVTLPPPVVWLTLDHCPPEAATNYCDNPPTLVLTGDEPLSGEGIIRIEGELDGDPFSCESDLCRLPLPDTDEDGIPLTFWAYSSYGDSSRVFEALVRVALDETTRQQDAWYVDVLSSQWRGEPAASCAESWQAFPPVGGAPQWLSTPADVGSLQTDFPYAYLAGQLIRQGMVYAGDCENGGMLPNGSANTCGVKAAQEAIIAWQNRFDEPIMRAADESQISAYLLKSLFARESQFWPGIFNAGEDVGLGQLTPNGADTAFLWNPVFFEQFCPFVLSSESCEKGYLHLDESEQMLIRNALVVNVNADCPECTLGLDLTQADLSVSVFAHTLAASCEQAGRVVELNTGVTPAGASSAYVDLWKFALVDYNAGPGCLGLAVNQTSQNGEPIDWEHVSANLTPVCAGTKSYVEDIAQ
jgi:hypothetical protein